MISQSIALFNLIKWAGVAYLFYIGFKSLRAGASPAENAAAPASTDSPRQSLAKAFALGFAANALNPKSVFFFLSVFASVVSVETPAGIKFGYGLVMASCLILWFVGVSYFMPTPRIRTSFARASRWIDRASGVVFIALGLKLATEKAG